MIEVQAKVNFADTDMMGVAHHANYFRWYEMGRVEYLRKAGILLLDLMAEDIVFPITDVNCQYLSSAYFDDEIIIQTQMTELSRIKMIFTYRIVRKSDGKMLAQGTTQNVFTNSQGQVKRMPVKYYDPLYNFFANDLNTQNLETINSC